MVWKTRQEEVWTEIAKLLGVESANTRTTGWFETRMVAVHNIIARMTAEENAELDEEVARMSKEGHSEEHKRQ